MKPLQLDHADLADRMIQGGALSFSSIWNHINKYLPDEAYTLVMKWRISLKTSVF